MFRELLIQSPLDGVSLQLFYTSAVGSGSTVAIRRGTRLQSERGVGANNVRLNFSSGGLSFIASAHYTTPYSSNLQYLGHNNEF